MTFLSEIRSLLQQSCSEPGMRYNLQLLNAIVLYVGTQAIQLIRNKGLSPNISTITHSAHMDIFQNLSVDLDTEGNKQTNKWFKLHICISICRFLGFLGSILKIHKQIFV